MDTTGRPLDGSEKENTGPPSYADQFDGKVLRPEKGAKSGSAVESVDFQEAVSGDEADIETVVRDSRVHEVLEELDRELVALEPVKQRIREVAALLVIDRLREEMGLGSERPTLHMSLTGNPGTGKTTVALRMAEILHRLGYLERGHLVSVTRDDLVGQYVGHTAPKTKDVVKRALGGILFIDEAYYLHRPQNERDYGQEAIEVLLAAMEQDRDKFVVVFAGYKEPMAEFFVANPGMGSRVAHHIDFPDYTVEELMQIAQMMLEQQGYEVSEAAEQAFREYVERRVEQPRFANGRSIRNAIERARMRQASRLFDAEETPSREQLLTIEDNDIRKSSVFADEQDAGAGTGPNGDTPDDAASDGRADTQDQSEEETCHVPSS